ncbi:hypothetical protein AA23498_0998 [Acetobacter nitrogenifigens DSM 23921 = NBRC 105050]|nr:hypothetical protein AA23498_0998 [Acetobacter nitrogenifigens DSM 23921 = NBRC 105050]
MQRLAGWLAVGGLSVVAASSLASAQPQSFVVTSVHVDHSGLWRADPNGRQTATDCKAFVLHDPEALKWFQASSEVDQHTWLEELDWTQCSADGTLQTGDGRSYSWELDQSGRGRIVLNKNVSVFLKGAELPFAN